MNLLFCVVVKLISIERDTYLCFWVQCTRLNVSRFGDCIQVLDRIYIHMYTQIYPYLYLKLSISVYEQLISDISKKSEIKSFMLVN